MSRRPPANGYIAIARALFEHPFFYTTKPYSRLEAWEWLINAASWKPQGHRSRFGVVHTERGELCITQRELAKRWSWPKTNVNRFLKKLAIEGMVTLGEAVNGPRPKAPNGPRIGYPMTLVTICNYDKFQKPPKWAKDQRSGQRVDQQQPPIPGLIAQIASQPLRTNINQNKKRKKTVGERRVNIKKPREGAISDDGTQLWCDYGGENWLKYAEEYRQVYEASIFPVIYIGGRGNWFPIIGDLALSYQRKHA
jgi:hypothetical protein